MEKALLLEKRMGMRGTRTLEDESIASVSVSVSGGSGGVGATHFTSHLLAAAWPAKEIPAGARPGPCHA